MYICIYHVFLNVHIMYIYIYMYVLLFISYVYNFTYHTHTHLYIQRCNIKYLITYKVNLALQPPTAASTVPGKTGFRYVPEKRADKNGAPLSDPEIETQQLLLLDPMSISTKYVYISLTYAYFCISLYVHTHII